MVQQSYDGQEQCWTNNVVHYCFNNVVERTMLFIIVSTMLLNEQCCSLLFQQCCWTNNVVHYCFNNVVERTMLFITVSTMLLNEQCCSLPFQQCCWTNNVVERIMLFSIDEATTVVGTRDWGENNIDIEQACSLLSSLLMVEPTLFWWLNKFVDTLVHRVQHHNIHEVQHNIVDNLQQVVHRVHCTVRGL